MLKARLHRMNWKNIFIILLFMGIYSIDALGQTGGNRVIINFEDSIKMIYSLHLLPPNNPDREEIIAFWHNYKEQPEYTLRITKRGDNQYYLEGRFLTQRISKIIFAMSTYDKGRYPIDVKLSSIPVSDTFTQNMRSAFDKTIDCQKRNKVYDRPGSYDGICYKFRINNGTNEPSVNTICDPEESSPCYNLVMLCKQMANDLRTNSFEESRYHDKIK